MREDLSLTAGGAAAQAGHAFLDSFLKAPSDITQAYLADGGTKIVLTVAGEPRLRAAYAAAVDAGLPCSLVSDDDLPGSPATALGIGPVERERARPITRRLSLMK